MIFYILYLIIKVCLIVHVVKTNRNTTWLYIILFIPVAGGIAYFIVEILPGLAGSRSGQKAQQNVSSIVRPNKNFKTAATNFELVDSVENTIQLAKEYIEKKNYQDAIQLYRSCLKGFHQYDPDILSGIAACEYELENYSETKKNIEIMYEHNPDYKNQEAKLLYVNSIAELGDTELAFQEYQALENIYCGPQSTYFHGMLHKAQGNTEEANALFQKIIDKSKRSPKQYTRMYKSWIKMAKKEQV